MPVKNPSFCEDQIYKQDRRQIHLWNIYKNLIFQISRINIDWCPPPRGTIQIMIDSQTTSGAHCSLLTLGIIIRNMILLPDTGQGRDTAHDR